MFFRKKFPKRLQRITTTQTLSLKNGEQLAFLFVTSPKTRRMYLKVSAEKGLEIVVPHRYNPKVLSRFVREKESWIIKNIQKVSHQKHQNQKYRQQFGEGMVLPILGEPKVLHLCPSTKIRPHIHETATEINIYGSTISALPMPERAGRYRGLKSKLALKKILERYLRQKIKIYLEERTKQIAQIMKTHYAKITVRAQKTRWGSCSRHNNLSFNWRLVFTPPQIVDYLIIHELAHTIHRNHSKKFHALVAKYCQNYKEQRRWLRKFQHRQMF